MADVGTTTTTLKIPSDDIVLPFRTVRSGVIGRLVRLGPAVDEILSHHAAPNAVSQTLGEAVALTALLGTALKIDGKLTLQTKTDGLLDFLVVSYEPPGRLRAYARYDKKRIGADDDIAQGELIGSGHLAITIDPGEDMERYQGIVALTGEGLGEAALTYFHQSEQLPSFVRLAVARHYTAGEKGAPGRWQWRAGGLMIQHLARTGGTEPALDEAFGDDEHYSEEDDDWERTRILASTVEDHELLDPTLAPDRLLYRLFHEEGVRAFPAASIEAYCRCSRERVEGFLRSFGAKGLTDMREPDGSISVTCEFCTKTYRFAPDEIA
ncbi:MAG: Hsp33 family molecular chaperone [Hyphomicrobium sp.]|jgi:molecular chaperone Hsp33